MLFLKEDALYQAVNGLICTMLVVGVLALIFKIKNKKNKTNDEQ